MSVELIDDGRIAGEKAYNADVDAAAAINPLKIGKTPQYPNWVPGNMGLTNATISGSSSTIFVTMPDATVDTIVMQLLSPLSEIVPGENATLHIWWRTAATTGNVRWELSIKPLIEGFTSLASAISRSVITPAGSANTLIESKILLPPSIFSNNQLIGLSIVRTPTNSLDTIAADAFIYLVYLEINGRS